MRERNAGSVGKTDLRMMIIGEISKCFVMTINQWVGKEPTKGR